MKQDALLSGRGSIRRYSTAQSLLLAGPLLLLLLVFYLYPLLSLFPESLMLEGQWTLEHYKHFFNQPLYSFILLRTIRIALYVTVLCFLIGYPVAYFLANLKSQRTCNLLMICILLPFFTSILVRSYAWIVLFQTKGIINKFLLSIGLIDKPLTLLYNEFAVLVGMVHIMLPFMILPVFSVLKSMDKNLLRAARNLGASAFKTFIHITLPLIRPGIIAAGVFSFITSLDELVLVLFLIGTTKMTLPLRMFTEIQFRIHPTVAAAATVFIVAAIGTIMALAFIEKKE